MVFVFCVLVLMVVGYAVGLFLFCGDGYYLWVSVLWCLCIICYMLFCCLPWLFGLTLCFLCNSMIYCLVCFDFVVLFKFLLCWCLLLLDVQVDQDCFSLLFEFVLDCLFGTCVFWLFGGCLICGGLLVWVLFGVQICLIECLWNWCLVVCFICCCCLLVFVQSCGCCVYFGLNILGLILLQSCLFKLVFCFVCWFVFYGCIQLVRLRLVFGLFVYVGFVYYCLVCFGLALGIECV